MTSVISELVVDCADPGRVASFWSQALGWEIQDKEDYKWMSASGQPGDGGLILVFQPVPEAKAVKNRLHIDVSPRGCEQQEEVDRLLALGARHADIGQGDVPLPWVVLADPEGNEFCVLRRRLD